MVPTSNQDNNLRSRKDDKERYRQQYESLKEKGQDKIHRLKDQILEYQTNIQAMGLEINKIKDMLFQEQEIRFKMQEQHDLESKQREESFKNELLLIQMDLTSRIEGLKNQVMQSTFLEQEKIEMSQCIADQQLIIQKMNEQFEKHQMDFEIIMEQKDKKIEDLKQIQKQYQDDVITAETNDPSKYLDQRKKLQNQCESILIYIKDLKQLKAELLALVIQQQNSKMKSLNSNLDTRQSFSIEKRALYRTNFQQLKTQPELMNYAKPLTLSIIPSPKGYQQELFNSLQGNISKSKDFYFLQGKQTVTHIQDIKKARLHKKLEQALYSNHHRTSFIDQKSPTLHFRKYSDVSACENRNFNHPLISQRSSKAILANQIEEIAKKVAMTQRNAFKK